MIIKNIYRKKNQKKHDQLQSLEYFALPGCKNTAEDYSDLLFCFYLFSKISFCATGNRRSVHECEDTFISATVSS